MLGILCGTAGISVVLGAAGASVGHPLVYRVSLPTPKPDKPPAPARPRPGPHAELIHALCPIFIEVARSDSEVKQDEIRIVKEFFAQHFHFTGVALDEVRLALKAAIAGPPADLEALV